MEVTLPSGNTATFRDRPSRGDFREARRGMKFIIQADGSRITDGSFLDDLTGRMITKMLVSWTYGNPVPSAAATEDLQQRMLDALDADDYAALEKAVGPWIEKLLNREQAPRFTHNTTGITVEVVNPGDADKLAASPDFTALAVEGADPKNALPATATSS